MIEKILITGSSGTIGARLCEKLIEKGFDVIGVDWRKNVWNKEVEARTIHLDLRSSAAIKRELASVIDVDAVIHLAANARVWDLVVDPTLARDNFETLFNILEWTREKRIKKFFFASSREVYGNGKTSVHQEKDALIGGCESPYTASKIGGEALVWSYHRCYGIDFIIFRFSNVYGLYDDSDRSVPLFIRLARENKDIVIFGKDKLLDFTYIDDTVDGIFLGIKKFNKAKNNVINIALGRGETVFNLAKLIKNELNSSSKILFKPSRIGEVVKYVADISLAKRLLGYVPTFSLKDGIEKSIVWYAEHCK